MDPPEFAHNVSAKGGNMILNRFCIDEDAGFELSGVYYLKQSSCNMRIGDKFIPKRNEKGKEYNINLITYYII